MNLRSRRAFLRDLGLSAAALPFVSGLPSLQAAEAAGPGKQRLIIMFSPNGTLPPQFWPDPPKPPAPATKPGTGDAAGPAPPPSAPPSRAEELTIKPMLEALAPFREHMLLLQGVSNRVRGDGDSHMRGMSCLLTGTHLHKGNIQGGSHTPAGWASGISIDQEIRNFLQAREETRTRFGSLEFGVAVPDRADPWTRMVYAGSNKPLAPVDDPYQMLERLYGKMKDKATLASILDDVRDDLQKVSGRISPEDKRVLDEHLALVRSLEEELQQEDERAELDHPEPELDPNIELVNDNTPRISRMQIDLLVNAMANDMTRIATLQFMRSVGQARMRWLGIEEGHHSLSHEPDKNTKAQEKLFRINQWFTGELAHLCQRLRDTPEPGGEGSMFDHTTIIWTNELGKGNSHTLENIPFVILGGGNDFRMNRHLNLKGTPHNRLWLALAHSFGHRIDTFGNPKFCGDGPLVLS